MKLHAWRSRPLLSGDDHHPASAAVRLPERKMSCVKVRRGGWRRGETSVWLIVGCHGFSLASGFHWVVSVCRLKIGGVETGEWTREYWSMSSQEAPFTFYAPAEIFFPDFKQSSHFILTSITFCQFSTRVNNYYPVFRKVSHEFVRVVKVLYFRVQLFGTVLLFICVRHPSVEDNSELGWKPISSTKPIHQPLS